MKIAEGEEDQEVPDCSGLHPSPASALRGATEAAAPLSDPPALSGHAAVTDTAFLLVQCPDTLRSARQQRRMTAGGGDGNRLPNWAL